MDAQEPKDYKEAVEYINSSKETQEEAADSDKIIVCGISMSEIETEDGQKNIYHNVEDDLKKLKEIDEKQKREKDSLKIEQINSTLENLYLRLKTLEEDEQDYYKEQKKKEVKNQEENIKQKNDNKGCLGRLSQLFFKTSAPGPERVTGIAPRTFTIEEIKEEIETVKQEISELEQMKQKLENEINNAEQ